MLIPVKILCIIVLPDPMWYLSKVAVVILVILILWVLYEVVRMGFVRKQHLL